MKRTDMKIEMEGRLRSFGRRLIKLPEHAQPEIANEFFDFEDRINQACREFRIKSFRRLMERLERFLTESEKRWAPSWIYPVWSKVLNCEVWFVSSADKISGLVQIGIPRGSIYTEHELRELCKVNAGRDFLKAVHEIKMVFDGTLAEIEDPALNESEPVDGDEEEILVEEN